MTVYVSGSGHSAATIKSSFYRAGMSNCLKNPKRCFWRFVFVWVSYESQYLPVYRFTWSRKNYTQEDTDGEFLPGEGENSRCWTNLARWCKYAAAKKKFTTQTLGDNNVKMTVCRRWWVRAKGDRYKINYYSERWTDRTYRSSLRAHMLSKAVNRQGKTAFVGWKKDGRVVYFGKHHMWRINSGVYIIKA